MDFPNFQQSEVRYIPVARNQSSLTQPQVRISARPLYFYSFIERLNILIPQHARHPKNGIKLSYHGFFPSVSLAVKRKAGDILYLRPAHKNLRSY